MAWQGELADKIASALSDRLPNVEIVAVNVRPELDESGDEVLFINVVFDGKTEQLDAARTSKIVRHIRPMIQEAGISAFPVFSFIAKSELGKLKPEAA
ncbi:MAG: hypothetical protein NXI16_12830 [Alphaproteobacteria bacterium]|nr:hypothetical protein [Alphaproteobacteria bacterium]